VNAWIAMRGTKVDIGRALSILELCPGLEVDEQLKLSTLEGETELNEVVSMLLAQNEDDEGMIEALKAQIDERKVRIGRFENRIEARKSAICSLMDCAMLTKLPLPEATLSLRTLQPRAKIMDEDQLPSAFIKQVTVRKPDKAAIDAAIERGENIPGVIRTNGGASLSVRRK
jgi:hypothetical protein